MKEFLRAKIFALSQYLEMLLSLILGLVIVILAGKLLMDVFNIFLQEKTSLHIIWKLQ